jgi:P27 family predicted phage terminase small subunit
MAKGRKKIPASIHKLKGTFDASRHSETPGNENRDPAMVPPDYLPCRAKEIFNELYRIIESLGYSDSSHSNMLALTAITLGEVETLSGALKDKPLSYQTQSTTGDIVWKAMPQVKQRSDAIRRAQSLLAEFGLSASSMNKVSKITGKQAFNPFEQFFNK